MRKEKERGGIGKVDNDQFYDQWCCSVETHFRHSCTKAWIRRNKLAVAVLGAAINHGHSNELFLFPVKAVYLPSL